MPCRRTEPNAATPSADRRARPEPARTESTPAPSSGSTRRNAALELPVAEVLGHLRALAADYDTGGRGCALKEIADKAAKLAGDIGSLQLPKELDLILKRVNG